MSYERRVIESKPAFKSLRVLMSALLVGLSGNECEGVARALTPRR